MDKLLNIPAFYIKDKQAFRMREGTLSIIGNPVDVAKKLAEKAEFIHIIDLDALKGISSNFDVYDKLTYFINIEVECAPRKELILKLLAVKSRVVVKLPAELSGLGGQKRLLVGKVSRDYQGDTSAVHDLVVDDAEEDVVERFSGKRIIIYKKDLQKVKDKEKIWGAIEFV